MHLVHSDMPCSTARPNPRQDIWFDQALPGLIPRHLYHDLEKSVGGNVAASGLLVKYQSATLQEAMRQVCKEHFCVRAENVVKAALELWRPEGRQPRRQP